MKRKLWMLFIALFLVGSASVLFTSCSDDDKVNEDDDDDDDDEEDDDEDDITWEVFVDEVYGGSNLNLNKGMFGLQDDQTIELKKSGEAKATVTLNNLLPEGEKIELGETTLTETGEGTGVFKFTITETLPVPYNATTVTVEGTVSMKDNKPGMTATISREIDSDLVGTFQVSKNGFFDIDMETAADLEGMLLGALGGIDEAIFAKVDDVYIDFNKDGTVGISWLPVGGKVTTVYDAISGLIGGMITGPELSQMVKIEYTTVQGMVFLCIDKSIIDLLGSLESMLPETIPMEMILGLLGQFDLGGYYGIPLNAATSGNVTKFFVDKHFVMNLAMMALPLIPEDFEITVTIEILMPGPVETDVDINIYQTIESLIEMYQQGGIETLDVGLNFIKQ